MLEDSKEFKDAIKYLEPTTLDVEDAICTDCGCSCNRVYYLEDHWHCGEMVCSSCIIEVAKVHKDMEDYLN